MIAVRSPASSLGLYMRRPIGFWFGQKRRASRSSIMITFVASAVSRSSKKRPATSLARIVSKYPGDTRASLGAISDSPFFA